MGVTGLESRGERLPTGTVTFLFTDIEGSTRLLHRLGERYGHVLSRHRELLRESFKRYGGCEVDTQGDAFFVAFPDAAGALRAAIDSQRKLHAEEWPAGEKLRVRMGVHTGQPVLVDGNYVGMDVHRAARICAVAHGEQVVVSERTRKDVGGPGAPPWKDLGRHRLKDLEEPEHLFQPVIEDLPRDFPQLRSLTPPTNVPRHVATLVGRERELADLHGHLTGDRFRLMTVTGPGGTGKTRVAAAAALEALDNFGDGVFFVDLTQITTAAGLLASIAETLGASIADEPHAELRNHIGNKRMLLLLDNFEQAISAADVVASLLQGCPHLKVLTTSRIMLSLNGELEFPLSPLSLPRDKTKDSVQGSEAGTLFLRRACAAKPAFELTDANASAVANICEVLDGLPLALELAAARLKLFPLEALLARLQDRLQLLTGGSSDSPIRHRTLRGTIEWSYELLSPDEKSFFKAFAVFHGGATLEAIEVVLAREEGDTLDILASLVNHSLVRQRELPDGQFRFDMLQTIREYALSAFNEDPSRHDVGRAHAKYYLQHLRVAREKNLDREPGFVDKDLDNFRAALKWFAEQATSSADDANALLELAGLLGRYWYTHGMVVEGKLWLRQGLDAASPGATLIRANALHRLGILEEMHKELDEAAAHFEEAHDMFHQLEDANGEAACLNSTGVVMLARGDLDGAAEYFERSAEIRKRNGDAQAASSLSNLGITYVHRGEHEQAVELLREAINLDESSGDSWGTAVTQVNLASAYLGAGDVELAHECVMASMQGCYRLEEYEGLCQAFEIAAGVALAQGDPERSARLYGSGERLWREMGVKQTPLDKLLLEAGLRRTEDALGSERFRSLMSEGALMTLDQAVNYGLGRHQQGAAATGTGGEQ